MKVRGGLDGCRVGHANRTEENGWIGRGRKSSALPVQQQRTQWIKEKMLVMQASKQPSFTAFIESTQLEATWLSLLLETIK